MSLLSDSAQFSSVAHFCLTLWPHESQHDRLPCPSPTPGLHSDSHPSRQWCHPAISSSVIPFSSCPQSLSESVFSNESTDRMRWPKYWSFSFSIIPSKEIPGLIFRMDCLDLLTVKGTLKSLLQNHSSKASILQCSAFFMVKLWQPYMITGKTIALTILGVHWKHWFWSWNTNTLATWCEELTHWKTPWCWETLRAGGEVYDRGWDGWMASPTQWTWVWLDSGSWWWTGRPDVLWFMALQRVGHNWVTEQNWYRHLLSKWYLCFLTYCLGLS